MGNHSGKKMTKSQAKLNIRILLTQLNESIITRTDLDTTERRNAFIVFMNIKETCLMGSSNKEAKVNDIKNIVKKAIENKVELDDNEIDFITQICKMIMVR
jgi:hypothetical protein